MADPPRYPGTPRWVKVSGIIAIILILLVAIVIFTASGVRMALAATHCPVPLLAKHRPRVATDDYDTPAFASLH